jgi:hypothetical protein
MRKAESTFLVYCVVSWARDGGLELGQAMGVREGELTPVDDPHGEEKNTKCDCGEVGQRKPSATRSQTKR